MQLDTTRPDARFVTRLASEAGTSPVWEIDVGGRPVAVLQPGVVAPLATAYAEEFLAMGARKADGVAHVVGRSWTTDAIYREIRAARRRRSFTMFTW